MFKTVLDIETVDEFFRVLAEAYPKYRYLVELDPSAATKKEDARKKAKKEAMKNGISEKPSGPGGRRQTKFDPGRKTRYAKGLKAGGMFRPARWRLDEDFDVSENIEEAECPGDGDEGSLFRLVSARFPPSLPFPGGAGRGRSGTEPVRELMRVCFWWRANTSGRTVPGETL